MAASAEFTVNNASNPAEHIVAYGSSVGLALVSTADVASVEFSIVGGSDSAQSFPSLTAGGIPIGATASFTMPADPGDGLGRGFRVKCRVVSVSGAAVEEHGVVGAANARGILPICAGETLDRDNTFGWVDAVNKAISGTVGAVTVNAQTGTSYTITSTDSGRLVTLTNASAITLTLPEDATEDIPVNFQCGILAGGAGQVETVKEGTDAIDSADNYTKLRTKASPGWIWKRGSGDWVLIGDLSA